MNQEPITINYIVDIQEFTADQIDKLNTSVTAIANANQYYLAVDDTDGKSKDTVLKPYTKSYCLSINILQNTGNS